jgi:hypothetical protein
MDCVCRQRFIACEACGTLLIVEYKPTEAGIIAVCDVVDLTEPGDEFQSFAPVYPAHYFCKEHGRNSRDYSLQEIKENVRIRG